ncbi:radical SAM protein [Marinobacter flavimaris]|uniref:radical SAM protein n=1 Tax=Marinobacter flavimaris TaxID=262076 RepID=UPI0038686A18
MNNLTAVTSATLIPIKNKNVIQYQDKIDIQNIPILEDNFGRKFEYLRLSITDSCNFRCNYCLPDGMDCNGEREFLSIDEIKTLVTSFARLGVKKVRITGGEPGLRKDLVDIIRTCKQIDGIEKVALTTNGFNLSRNAESWAIAGLDAINVSMDTPLCVSVVVA